MSAASSSISNQLIWIDHVCDYVPVISTVTNLVNIIEKCLFSCFCSSKSINESRYISYIVNEKSSSRCVVLTIPILGNIIVAVFDLMKNETVSLIPQYTILDVKIGFLDMLIKDFIDIINTNNHKQVDKKWKQILRATPYDVTLNNDIKFEYIGQDEGIQQRQAEIDARLNQLLELRRNSYTTYVESLEDDKLLVEAKIYYVESFSEDERESIDVEKTNPRMILPLLRKRVEEIDQNPLHIVEMEIIISELGKR